MGEEEAPRYCTFQRVPGEAQLADDVAGDVCLDDLAHLGMVLCCLQTVQELLWVKLLLVV